MDDDDAPPGFSRPAAFDDDAPPGFDRPAGLPSSRASGSDPLPSSIGRATFTTVGPPAGLVDHEAVRQLTSSVARASVTDRISLPPGINIRSTPVDQEQPSTLPRLTAQQPAPQQAQHAQQQRPAPSQQAAHQLWGDAEEPQIDVESESIYTSASTWQDLPLREDLLAGLYNEMHFDRPSAVQARTLPMILKGPPYLDLIAQAHNGSGKTTCFVLAMLSRVDPSKHTAQALCMCPTRELVVQNLMVLRRMAKHTTITAVSTADEGMAGGIKRREPITAQVVIGTHGRLKDWVGKKLLDPRAIQILVFDEADDMLKMDGFADDSVRLIKTVRTANPGVQLLLFSATFNDKVRNFAEKICPRANKVFIAKEELSLDVIAQYNVHCSSDEDKVSVLRDTIFPVCDQLGQTIIFTKTRQAASTLHTEMSRSGHKVTSIRGDMQHEERDAVVDEFRKGTTKILIATDVLARGFDVNQVTLVINYDVPVERDGNSPAAETYMHRIGRSGRFGRKGAAFNFICGPQEERRIKLIADFYQRQIPYLESHDEDAFEEALIKAGLKSQG